LRVRWFTCSHLLRFLHATRVASNAHRISAVGGDTAVHKDIPAAHAVRQTVPLTTQAAVVEKHRPVAGEPLSDDGIHIIFSTSCSMFQRWQAELLFYSHAKVKQRGSITRLVSGCKPPVTTHTLTLVSSFILHHLWLLNSRSIFRLTH
jgi:hypothetical protein